jgi:hypothetical protein
LGGQYGLGYDPSKERHDELRRYSIPFLMRATAESELQTFDPRGKLIYPSQFNLGSCEGHEIALCMQYINFLATGKIVPMSRMWGYLQAQIKDGGMRGDMGASIAGGVAAMKDVGMCKESTFPYPNPVQYVTRWPANAPVEAKQHRLKNSSVMQSYEDVRHWVGMAIGPTGIGINWTPALANNRSGVIRLADCKGQSLGGHALALVSLASDRSHVWLVNSHGEQWGDRGCAQVEPEAVDYWCKSGAAVIGVSDMETYGRRHIPVGDIT